MSYDISLTDAQGRTIMLGAPHDLAGGNYALGGTEEAWLNVTYNYSRHFYRVLGDKGIRAIYGMTGRDSIPVLAEAAGKLGTDVDPDYWRPTEGNARKALLDLIALATLAPEGVWDVD